MSTASGHTANPIRIDLSIPDNTLLVRGRSRVVEALWIFFAAPLLASRIVLSSGFRVFLLRLFGAKVGAHVYIKPGVRVKFPWYLSIGDYSWIGEDVWIDNLAEVSIASHVCVSPGVYFCTGNHDWSAPNMRLFSKPIRLETGCWVGARSVVCPGVRIAEGAVLSVGAIATKDLAAFGIYAGNPAVFVRKRIMKD